MRLNINLTEGKTIKNVYFTSDWHLFHNNVLKFDKRPYDNVHDMHLDIEEKWNDLITEDDIVIYLGDLSFARREDNQYVLDMMNRLKGTIHFVMGNHDKIDDIKKITKFSSVQDFLEVRITHFAESPYHVGVMEKVETLFNCFHYPIFSWNKKHHGSYHVHGHCHGGLHHGEEDGYYTNKRVIDVGCMLHNYTPISYTEVMEKLKHVKIEKLTR
jgi:calcineurin-like phosphoesterase family protein